MNSFLRNYLLVIGFLGWSFGVAYYSTLIGWEGGEAVGRYQAGSEFMKEARKAKIRLHMGGDDSVAQRCMMLEWENDSVLKQKLFEQGYR